MSRTPVNSQSNSDSFKKLQEKLKEMFLLDCGDLDFGIYRIMQSNRDKIEKFLNDDLLPQVKTALTVKQSADRSLLQKQMDEAISQASSLGVDPDAVPKIHDMRQKLTESVDLHKIENEIYSDLYNFFKRYYSEGDFLSLRRYKEGVYALPYEGEEVKLHWANADQYYIKSTENLSSYVFRTPSNRRVRFEVVEGHTEQNNNKAEAGRERRFMLVQENPVTINQGDVILRFEYKPDPYHREQWRPKRQAEKQTLNKITVETVKKCLSDQEEVRELFFVVGTDNKPDRTLLEKHLDCFTARNTFDYFIHKDLGGFLRRELDFYIKNEIMYLDDIENESVPRVEQYLSKIKVLRLIAGKIIRFLEQLENFQKKLWLKKKFVLETQYCMTLDRIPESFYAEIAANEEQRKEWVRLFAIDEIREDTTKPGYSEPLTIDFLKATHFLVLDTVFFDRDFKERLLGTLDHADEQINGHLIHSENFNGLNFINTKFSNKIKCIYIDPPFNLRETPDYLYKVDYKDSCWLTLLENRIFQSRALMSTQSSIMVRCSHHGNMLIRLLLNQVFGITNYRNEIIIRRAEESKGDLNSQFESVKSITVNYDNIYWYSIHMDDRFHKIFKPATQEQSKAHWHSFWKAENRPNMRYAILGVDLIEHRGQWMWSKERAYAAVQNYIEYENVSKQTLESLEDYWRRTGEKLEFIKREGNGISSIKYWIRPRTFVMADNNWLDIKGYANKWGFKTENSEALLRRIIESLTNKREFVLDYFLGSGTTVATSHKLNRRWIGIEMGKHFDMIIVPRLKAVLFGENSGISKDIEYVGGGCFKYMRLESYEDTLDNLELHPTAAQDSLLKGNRLLREDYMLSYWLDVESKGSNSLLNLQAFTDPFNYKLRVTRHGVVETAKVDLVETFNWLLGLTVLTMKRMEDVYVVTGTDRRGDKIVILWRHLETMSNKQLDQWFDKQMSLREDCDLKLIYVNGDCTLEALKQSHETWTVRLIETDFHRLMFDVQDV